MWKEVLLIIFACSLLDYATAQGGAESLSFHGFLPIEYLREKKPIADNGPNDIYGHLAVRKPKLLEGEIVIYPHHFGFEYGQDPEQSVYEVHNAVDLVNANSKHSKKHHHKDHHHKEQQQSQPSVKKQNSYTLPPLHDRPPPIHPTYITTIKPQKNRNTKKPFTVHPHFG